jgi:hypothetical protein
MIQADCVITESSVIVSLYRRHEEKGMVVSLSHDLRAILWETHFPGRIVSTPVLFAGEDLCVLVGGTHVVIVDVATGVKSHGSKLSERSNVRPLVIGEEHRTVLFCGENGSMTKLDLTRRSNTNPEVVVKELITVGDIGPVHRDVLYQSEANRLVISGSDGACCKSQLVLDASRPAIQIAATALKTDLLASYPLSSAEPLRGSSVVVGAYDGSVYVTEEGYPVRDLQVGACVYAKPLALPSSQMEENSFVVCTTAGDVLRVGVQVDGSLDILWKYRVAGELWSDPVLVEENSVAFGARDSHVHIVNMNGHR